MRIQYKLLILLMAISLIPLLVVRATVRRDLSKMSENLAERSENILVHKASTGLQRIVEDHARVLRRERQLLESTAMLLASRIEGVLYGHSHTPQDSGFIPADTDLGDMAKQYFLLRMGRQQALDVDFKQISIQDNETDLLLEHLTPLLGKVKFDYPKLVLWSRVTLNDGAVVTYPKVAPSSRRMGRMGMMTMPESEALKSELAWTLPKIDPVTRRMVFEVIAPIRDVHAGLAGNLTLVVPVDAVLHEGQHISMFSSKADSMLIRPETNPGDKSVRVRLIAEENMNQMGAGHWMVPEIDSWIASTDVEQSSMMADSLLAGKAGVVGMPFKGGDALWAFAPIDENGTSLLLIVPKSDIVKDAHAARVFVEKQVDEYSRKTGYVVLAVAAFILLLALLLSRVFTRNITELANAVRSVSKGNFSVRASVRSTDEVGQLGMAFNNMVPELKERVSLKNALEVAQEVQQSLLPSGPPEFTGADIAATSTYCDETGGDYYGFIHRTSEDGEGLVVAVGDVSGHGMQAALLMSSVRAYLRSQLSGGSGLDQAVARVNELVTDDVEGTGRFMTLFLLELISGGARWVRAGHDPAMLYDPETDTFEELLGDGLPLGVMHDVEFEVRRVDGLKPGQWIVIGTDGIWEMLSESGEMFGKDRLKEIVRHNANETSAQLVEQLSIALNEFRGETGQLDDVTVAVVKIL